jgi:hypothetical protein
MAVFGQLRNHPQWLERVYQLVEKIFNKLDPLIRKIGYKRVDRWVHLPEKFSKEMIFDCQMCGQCTLHFTGMTCPMTCPKNLRNGPCGGVRSDKTCEVDPEMICIWVEAYERSTKMKVYGNEIRHMQSPLNQRFVDKSAFINLLCCEDGNAPPAWKPTKGTEILL